MLPLLCVISSNIPQRQNTKDKYHKTAYHYPAYQVNKRMIKTKHDFNVLGE